MPFDHDSLRPTRRNVLHLIGGAPLFPLAAGASTLLAGCAATGQQGARYASAEFVPMPAPSLAEPQAMATTTVASALKVTDTAGRSQTYRLGYEAFFTTGEPVPDGRGGQVLAGGYYDIHNRPIIDRSVPGRERQFFSDCPDGTSLVAVRGAKVPGVKGNAVFAVVQFEYTTRDLAEHDTYGRLPSPIAVLTLDQDRATGRLALVKYHNVDTSGAHGLWITCGASLSPWGTHLSSEEYEPDAAALAKNQQFRDFSRNLYGDEAAASVYHYGHLPEVTVHPDGTGTVVKHYNLGRISHELVQVMPDERTVLMGDDATNGGLFMFIADAPRDLSAGTLYVARWHQTSSEGPGAGDISWVRLGHATSDEIEALAGTFTIDDIMEVKTADPGDATFRKIPYNGTWNWIKVQPGMEKAAAFLETHRYAALVGGSLGFTKMEGTTVNARDKKAYSAMSYIYKSMTDGSGGIKVQGPKAGAVYEHTLAGGQKDSEGRPIASEWVSVRMHVPAGLAGADLKTPDALGNLAAADRIANPDNLKFSEQLRTLFIGEDSGMHVNNFLWAYNVDTGKLSRILSAPAGAESTGLHAVDQINGWTYVMSNFQHAGDWEKGLHDKVKATLDPLVRAAYGDRYGASVGYITGMPGTQGRSAA